MREFWNEAAAPGRHPQDVEMMDLHPDRFVHWNLDEANDNADNLPGSNVLHVGLHPQPFIGNITDPLIFVLHGNPGLSFRDYTDEFENHGHAAACVQNLQNAELGFFPLGEMSAGTGAAQYWLSAFDEAIAALAEAKDIGIDESRDIFRCNIGLIESCAYHSKRTPDRWTDTLPSSRLAREYVHDVVFPRGRHGDSLVFIWRRVGHDDYWGRGDAHPNIMVRAARMAQSGRIFRNERMAIVNFLAAHLD
ncbi:MAG: hypothetical protein M0Z85_08340 [Gammaproteobacteria bacterium]|nr:hypothetical protein [Gammaproteobacteria bacterium]